MWLMSRRKGYHTNLYIIIMSLDRSSQLIVTAYTYMIGCCQCLLKVTCVLYLPTIPGHNPCAGPVSVRPQARVPRWPITACRSWSGTLRQTLLPVILFRICQNIQDPDIQYKTELRTLDLVHSVEHVWLELEGLRHRMYSDECCMQGH